MTKIHKIKSNYSR